MQISSKAVLGMLIAGCIIGSPHLAAQEPTREQMLEQLSNAMRGLVEPTFKESVGFGFVSFACEVETDLGPGSRFDCTAVDEEGERIRYTLEVDDEGMATVVLATQFAENLTAEDRTVLEPPCLKFLDLYSLGEWDTLISELHPALLATVPGETILTQLAPIREALGEVRSVRLVTYSRYVMEDQTTRHELAYDLECTEGPGVARLGLFIDDEGPRVAAYVVSPSPGSPIHAEMLSALGCEMISSFVDEPVERMDAPIDQLQSVNDAVEGTAWLSDGREIRIGVVQQGRHDDFDIIDYRFQVLEVSWLLMRAFAARPDPAVAVECPTRVAPDGGTLTCRAEFASGEARSVTVARSSGDHRIIDSQPITN
jgi:hypothetical protein